MKKKIKNTLIVLIIVALSAGIGFGYDRYDHAKKLKEYPRKYQAEISSLSYEYSVPTSVIYAVIKINSDFDASYSEDGKIGLFALTSEQYNELEQKIGNTPLDSGLLYEPNTSLRLGIKLLSDLFVKYGKWKTVYAAMYAGEQTVDEWISKQKSDTRTGLTEIPDEKTAEYVENCLNTVKIYDNLYEGKSE